MAILANKDMREGRYLVRHKARQLYGRIVSHLRDGGSVVVVTYTRATKFGPQHVDSFRVDEKSVLARFGERWDCIATCGVYGNSGCGICYT